ncbi:glycosyltransferase family 2 protein [Candidatus Omnitrophota bacterium]
MTTHATRKDSISVILCTKNEAGGIQELVQSVKPYANEVIVIDGHSTDNTAELAKKAGAKVWQDNGKGKGDAYAVGIQKATGDVIVLMDADGSHDPRDIPVLAEPIVNNESDLVIGSRHKGGSDEWAGDLDTYLRAIGSGFLSVIINYRWKTALTDVLNGFRALSRASALKVPLYANDFDIEQHMIVQYRKHGHRVMEVRSHEFCRRWGESKLPTFRKAYLFFWRLFLDLVTGK